MQVISTTHIEVDERGVAWIRGANTKIIQVVMDKMAEGWTPEEIHLNYPHLSLAQIYAAFSYYYDNQEKLDAQIAQELRNVEEFMAEAENRLSRQDLLSRLK
jgi:uncharacterized protein (DUF433 family)